MQHHRRAAFLWCHWLRYCPQESLGGNSSCTRHLTSPSHSFSSLTDRHRFELKSCRSEKTDYGVVEESPRYGITPLLGKSRCLNRLRSLIPPQQCPANGAHIPFKRGHVTFSKHGRVSDSDYPKLPVKILQAVDELVAGSSESTTASELNEFVKQTLSSLPHGISSGTFRHLVSQTSLPASLMTAMTRWAVCQSDWRHSSKLYARLVLHMSEQQAREGIIDIVEILLDCKCSIDLIAVTQISRQLNRIGLPELTLRLVTALEEQGTVPDGILYGVQMVAFSKQKNLKGAMNLLERIDQTEAGADRTHYNTFLLLCGELRHKVLLEETVLTMVRRGIEPDGYTCSILIQAYGLMGEPDTAMTVAHEMRQLGVKFNFSIYGALLNAQIKNKNVEEARKVVRDALSDQGLPRDAAYYQLLLLWQSNPLNVHKLLESHQEMIDAGFGQPASLYNKLVFRLQSVGELEAAKTIMLSMRVTGNKPLKSELYEVVVAKLELKGYLEDASAIRDSIARNEISGSGSVSGFVGVTGQCLHAISVRDVGKLSKLITEIRVREKEVHPSLYMYIMVMLQKSSEESERSSLMTILDTCGIECHEVVKLLLDESQAESSLWPAVQFKLERLLITWKGVPSQFINCLIALLCANGLHLRAARVWKESRDLSVTMPEISGLKVEKGNYKLDLHSCTVPTGKVIACVELGRVIELLDSENDRAVEVITGKGNKSRVVGYSILREGIGTMLQRLRSPFKLQSGNAGCFISSVGAVKMWLRQEGVMDAMSSHANKLAWKG